MQITLGSHLLLMLSLDIIPIKALLTPTFLVEDFLLLILLTTGFDLTGVGVVTSGLT